MKSAAESRFVIYPGTVHFADWAHGPERVPTQQRGCDDTIG